MSELTNVGETVKTLLDNLMRTIVFDGNEFKVLNPETSVYDWEYGEDGKVSKVYNMTSDHSIVSDFVYNENGYLEKLSTTVDGEEASSRILTYDDQNRLIREESNYEIITRDYDDENGSLVIVTRDIEDETIKTEELIKDEKSTNELEIGYRKCSEIVRDKYYNYLSRIIWEFNDEDGTFKVTEEGIIPGKEGALSKISEKVFRQDVDATLEISNWVRDDNGKFIEKQTYKNTYDAAYDKLLHVDLLVNDEPKSFIDYVFDNKDGKEIETIIESEFANNDKHTTTIRFIDSDGVLHEDYEIVLNNETYATGCRLNLGSHHFNLNNLTNLNETSMHFDVYGDDGNCPFSIHTRNNKLIGATFKLVNKQYDYHLMNDINAKVVVTTYDEDDIIHVDEVYFKHQIDESEDLTDYIVTKLKECIKYEENVKMLFEKGGFDYEKIGGTYSD